MAETLEIITIKIINTMVKVRIIPLQISTHLINQWQFYQKMKNLVGSKFNMRTESREFNSKKFPFLISFRQLEHISGMLISTYPSQLINNPWILIWMSLLGNSTFWIWWSLLHWTIWTTRVMKSKLIVMTVFFHLWEQ